MDGVGGEQAMLLPLRAVVSYEVTVIFTTACQCAGADRRRTSTIEVVRWGTADIGVSDGNTGLLAEDLRCGAWRPSPGHLHSACVKGGIRTRFSMERSIRHLHHQRRLSRASSRRAANQNSFAAQMRRVFANSEAFALPSVSGSSPRSLRQAPRAWARACSREPRDPGLPFRLAPGKSSWTVPSSGQQKTLRSRWLGRVRHFRRTVDPFRRDRSDEPGTRYRSAQSRSIVRRAFRIRTSSSNSCLFANGIAREGGGHTPARLRCQAHNTSKL